MAEGQARTPRSGALHRLVSIGTHGAAAAVRPLTGAAGVAAEAGISVERRAVDRLLASGELERLLDSARVQGALAQIMASRGAKRLIDSFFDSGLFDHFVDRLLASDGLWHLIDEVAASPAVTAAISQQGLGFADQVGGEVRTRSRRADDRLERIARRLVHRAPYEPAVPPEGAPS